MRTVKKRSQLQEKSVARDLNAKTIVASGALWNAKGDVRNDKFLIECKTTEKGFYSITSTVWNKIEEEACRDRMRTPLLVVDLRDSERYVIFNPKSFDYNPDVYEVVPHVHGGCKSYRFKGYSSERLPIMFSLTKPAYRHISSVILIAMAIDDFIETFKEEI